MTDLTALRARLRQERRAISTARAADAQASALGRLERLPGFRRAGRIAGYVGVRGEIDTRVLLRQATARGKTVLLPVLHPFKNGQLWFCRWSVGQRMRKNRFDIPEPHPPLYQIPARDLDLIIVPLLGFDTTCHRLGMGGGYYDRTLAFVDRYRSKRRPLLIGLAHDFQRVEVLQPQPWDIQLDAVVTPTQIHTKPTTRMR